LGLATVRDLGTAGLVSAVTLLLWATLAPLLVRGLLAAAKHTVTVRTDQGGVEIH
jgi:hypothetical protein